MNTDTDPNPQNYRDADRLLVLDRIEHRIPDLDLGEHVTEWVELPDGAEALSIDGGGMDGGAGMMIANAPNRDLHVLGSFAPLAPYVGCVAVHPDGSREVVRAERDPLAHGDDEQ